MSLTTVSVQAFILVYCTFRNTHCGMAQFWHLQRTQKKSKLHTVIFVVSTTKAAGDTSLIWRQTPLAATGLLREEVWPLFGSRLQYFISSRVMKLVTAVTTIVFSSWENEISMDYAITCYRPKKHSARHLSYNRFIIQLHKQNTLYNLLHSICYKGLKFFYSKYIKGYVTNNFYMTAYVAHIRIDRMSYITRYLINNITCI